MPGAFKLDHLQPIKPLLFQYFFTFSTFILGDHFLLPQKANYQKWEFFQLQNRMRQGVFSAWGIQTRPFAALCTSHILKLYHLFHLHTGRPILITPEGQLWEKGVLPTPKLDETEGFGCLGHSNWTICSPLHLSHSQIIPSFLPSYWEAISYYPRGPIMGKGSSSNSKTG